MNHKQYLKIISHYESCLERHGDNHRGVDWPRKEDAETRYRVMLDVIRPGPPFTITLLDFGCGASHLYEYILRREPLSTDTRFPTIAYSGLDLSERFIRLSRDKFRSNTYYCLDILDEHANLPDFDYIVMNGVFTEKLTLSFHDMLLYFQVVVRRVFTKARIGIAFNLMSKHVDWERDDLFHLSFEELASFLVRDISRHFIIRHDYGLHEYTTYVYKSISQTSR